MQHSKIKTAVAALCAAAIFLGGSNDSMSAPEAVSPESNLPPAEHAEHGLPQAAVEIARPFGFPITNSMLVTWAVAIALIALAQLATRHMTRIPKGAQNFWEWLVESLSKFLESVIGRHLVQRTFWFFASVFIFILFCNWAGLIPGFGTVGWRVEYSNGQTGFLPW